MMQPFRFRRDENGRPVAEPPSDASDRNLAGLADFLTSEARWPDYVAQLLGNSARAKQARASESSTGNAFAVTFTPSDVTIEHLFLDTWPKVTVPMEVFSEVAEAWLAWLKAAEAAGGGSLSSP